MRICMLLDDTYPEDIRVTKEVKGLLDRDHEVWILCFQQEGAPRREVVDGAQVIRRPMQQAHRGIMGLRPGLKYLLTHEHTAWRSAIDEVVAMADIEALHPHDLPLVKTALAAGQHHGLPVVADLHENWPEAVRQYRTVDDVRQFVRDPSYFVSRIATPISRLKRLERSCVQRVQHVITVAPEAKSHYVEDCGVAPDRVSVVSNTVDLARFDPTNTEPVGYGDDFVLGYVGTLGGEHRGLKPIIDAMPSIAAAIPNVRLLIVGSGSGYEAQLRKRAHERGVSDRVTFTGWVDFAEVPGYIAASDVCLVPHRSTPHTETTIPHKLFQYMALERPVIVTDVAPLARIVKETEAGLVVPDADTAALIAAVKELRGDPDMAATYGRNGRRAVEGRYNWRNDCRRLLNVYDELAGYRSDGELSRLTVEGNEGHR